MNRIEQQGRSAPEASRAAEPLRLFAWPPRARRDVLHEWASLRQGRTCPVIADVARMAPVEAASGGLLVALPHGEAPPRLLAASPDAARHWGLNPDRPVFADLPRASLLVQLVRRLHKVRDHGGPLRFEADFLDPEGRETHYTGNLLPFVGEAGAIELVRIEVEWRMIAEVGADIVSAVAAAGRMRALPLQPPVDGHRGAGTAASLLAGARTWAALAATGPAVRETSLHAALGATHDLLIATDWNVARLAALAGVPSRTPASAIAAAIGLVFGDTVSRRERADRAAVLAHARRLGLGTGMLGDMLRRIDHGVPALAAAEREARRIERAPSPRREGMRTLGEIAFTALDGELPLARPRPAEHWLAGRRRGAG